MNERDVRYLNLLAREYPTAKSASAEIINLTAILNLPKGTEHFMSDIHGEAEAFLHILNSGSGAVAEKINAVFDGSLVASERRTLAALIYYPKEKIIEAKETNADMFDWYCVTLRRLVSVCRVATSKYSRSKVRKAMPREFAYIMEELLNTQAAGHADKDRYYDNIIRAIVDTDSADQFIIEMCTLIKRMTVDVLHIVGDIFDRGPHADVIIDELIKHHNVDVQWGNHDVLWMGAAAGSEVCIATAVRNCVQYDNLDMLENAYGINLMPLALFATETYTGDTSVFEPRKLPEETYKPRDLRLYARMLKAMSVIQFKLEGQLIARNPEYLMADRDMLSRVNWEKGTIKIGNKDYPLRDTDFPTVNPLAPNELSADEKSLMEQLVSAFLHSDRLQQHIRFLYSSGSLYCCINGNLLYHGCMPCNKDGTYMTFELGGNVLFGKEFLDYSDALARQGYFAAEGTLKRRIGQDYLWFLWSGRNSPIFGRSHITTFERALLEDKETYKEPKNPYYEYYDDEEFCTNLLEHFSMNKPWSRIINGHIPVKAKEGENPVKARGKLVVIDGGFCSAYHNQTGIAGYTMFFNSNGVHLAAHEPFTSRQDAINNCKDITSHMYTMEDFSRRVMVADIDTGDVIRGRIEDLRKLLAAFKSGDVR